MVEVGDEGGRRWGRQEMVEVGDGGGRRWCSLRLNCCMLANRVLQRC